MASVWTLQFHTVSFQHRVSPSLLEFRARFWLDRGGYNSFNRSYILKRIELRAARNSLNGDDVRQLPEKSNFVESKNKIILIPKNVITKLQVTVGSCPPIVFLTKKHPGAGFAVGIFVIATLLIIAVRNHMLRKSRYSSPGTVADLVRRGQLRSDRRGISSPLKYEDPFNNPMVKVSKSNSTVEMGGKVYRLAPVTLTREQQAIHQKRRSRAYQWKRPTLFLREGDSIPPDVDPDTIRWIPANHPFATTESEIDEDLAQNNVYQKHGVPFRIQAEHEALQRKLEALQSEAESELLWETFLPPDYRDIICRLISPIMFESKKELFVKLLSPLLIDGGHKTFCIDRESSKKCFTLSSRELSIAFSRNALYWCWKPLLGSRFPEIVELIMVSWLEIKGSMNTRMLSPNTTYGAYFIFKLADRAFGLDSMPSEISIKVGNHQSDRIIYLRQNSYNKQAMERLFMLNRVETLRSRLHEQQECTIHERDDGWLEIELGEFYNDGSEKEVQMSLREVKGEHLKGGLIVEGIELRPK